MNLLVDTLARVTDTDSCESCGIEPTDSTPAQQSISRFDFIFLFQLVFFNLRQIDMRGFGGLIIEEIQHLYVDYGLGKILTMHACISCSCSDSS